MTGGRSASVKESDRAFAARMQHLLEIERGAVHDEAQVIDLRDEVRFAAKAVATLPVLAPIAWGVAQLVGSLPH